MVSDESETADKTQAMEALERAHGIELGAYLREQYVEKSKTTREIGATLGVNQSTVTRWLAEFGIPARAYGPRRA